MNYNYFNDDINKMLDSVPLLLIYDDEEHILVFRRLIEWSMTIGLWSGQVGVS